MGEYKNACMGEYENFIVCGYLCMCLHEANSILYVCILCATEPYHLTPRLLSVFNVTRDWEWHGDKAMSHIFSVVYVQQRMRTTMKCD